MRILKLQPVLFAFLATIVIADSAARGETILIVSQCRWPIVVWFWNNDDKEWLTPPLAMDPGQRTRFHFRGKHPYYIVARTQSCTGADQIVGWTDFHKIVERDRDAIFTIDGRVEQRLVQRTYIVCVPEFETRTRDRTVYRWRLFDGGWQFVPEIITEEYVVRTYVPKRLTRQVTVSDISAF